MYPLTYVLQFQDKAMPAADPAGPLIIKSMASSNSVTTTIDGNHVSGAFEPTCGGTAAFESQSTFTSPTGFHEAGTITFGNAGDHLRFSTVGEGLIGPSAVPAVQSGCVLWRVDGGEGSFAGASGFITSNFTVDAAGNVTDNQLAILFPPAAS